jgi:hypothetical protein
MGCVESSPYNQGSKSQMAFYGNNSNWMGKYLPFLRDKKIIELTIPGTHDSGTYKTTGALKELALSQNIFILQQLQ